MFIVSTLTPDALAELREWVDQRVAEALARREQREWLTVEEAARYLNCSVKAVYHRIARGQLTAHREGRRVYLKRSEIDRDLGRST